MEVLITVEFTKRNHLLVQRRSDNVALQVRDTAESIRHKKVLEEGGVATSERERYPSDRSRLLSDECLVERAIDGDMAAFETLVSRHGPLMRAHTSRIVGSRIDADDVVQESFIIAWRQLPTLRYPGAVRPWLMRIASRQAFAHVKRRPRDTPLPSLGTPVPIETQPELAAVRNEELRALSVALDRLPEDQRRCWLLREIDELSYSEIAGEMHLSPATVRGKLARARISVTVQMEGWR